MRRLEHCSVEHRLHSASGKAFAAIVGDGSVVTWGNAHNGGDSRAVQEKLSNAANPGL